MVVQTTITWKKEFEIGHERIDGEHRIFFNLISNIERDFLRGLPAEKIARDLEELRRYADFHFYSEENIMQDIAYPERPDHIRLHRALMGALKEEIIMATGPKVDIAELVSFLFQWLCVHIITEDNKLAKFIDRGNAEPDEFIAIV